MACYLHFFRFIFIVFSLSIVFPVWAHNAEHRKIEHFPDIVWASPKGFDLKLDIAVPAATKGASDSPSKSKPVLVILHGGGWLLNNKSIMSDLADSIASRAGIITVNVDYRLLSDLDNTTTLDEIVEDAMGAVLWVKQHIHRYGGDPDRVAITGDSAGGHLAAMVAVAGHSLGSEGFAEKPLRFKPTYLPEDTTAEQVAAAEGLSVQATILSYAAFNLLDIAKGGMETADNPFWAWADAEPRGLFGDGITATENPEYYLAVSPNHYLVSAKKSAYAPQFLHVGEQDTVTTPENTRVYVEQLKRLGQPVRLVVYEGKNHGYLDSGCNDYNNGCFKELSEPAVSDMIAFLQQVFAL